VTRITNSDQVLILLRSHLQRAERSHRKDLDRKDKTRAKPTPLERVQTIARNEDLSSEEIERALISGIFTEEFGSGAANDPDFQLMVDNVLRMIRENETGRQLLGRAVAQLTIGGR
jgi:hypothetical protein